MHLHETKTGTDHDLCAVRLARRARSGTQVGLDLPVMSCRSLAGDPEPWARTVQ